MTHHFKPHFIGKRFLTLLEVLLAMTFTMMILTTLGYFYRQIDVMNTETERSLEKNFQMRYLENRLAHILPNALSEHTLDKQFFFFTTSNPSEVIKEGSTSLVFVFDNGIDRNKSIANEVIGKLYLDKQNRLCLAIWPLPNKWEGNELPQIRKEVLIDKVDSISFEFYVAPEKERDKILSKRFSNYKKPTVIPERSDKPWIEKWSHDYRQLPAMVKVHIKRVTEKEPEEATFTYMLPRSEQIIFYDK